MQCASARLARSMIDRQYCLRHRVALPSRFPVTPRHDLATRRAVVVDRRDGAELLCAGGHAGPHVWPDGVEVVSDTPNVPER